MEGVSAAATVQTGRQGKALGKVQSGGRAALLPNGAGASGETLGRHLLLLVLTYYYLYYLLLVLLVSGLCASCCFIPPWTCQLDLWHC